MSANRNVIRWCRSLPASRRLAAIALVLLVLAGCRSAAPTAHLNPIDPSFALPAAKTLDYPGPQRFWNTAGLVISPARIVAQVGGEVPMFAGICDGKGQLLPHEKVEWMLDGGGVGSLVSVADPIRPFCLELVSTKARKIDNTYAETETSPANVILTRGTADLNDDMVMPRGYTWVTVTSPVEGSSYVTAYGPDVYSWDVRQKSARIIWIDAEWCFPEAACAQPGVPVTLVTTVCRRTTGMPVSDWIVKYTITGGAAAGFGTDNAQSVEIATGEDGRAAVDLVPAADAPGTTCINVELIRSECATPSSPERISIATAATQVTWGISEPPAPPPSVPAAPTVPETPPATPPPSIPPSTAPEAPPPTATPAPPAPPQIALDIRGPQTAELGEDIKFDIEVTNRGAARATGLVMSARFDEGLRHATGARALDPREIGNLEAGQTIVVPLNFRTFKSGQQCFTIDVSDLANPGVSIATKQHCVTVREEEKPPPAAAMTVEVTGPDAAVVGQDVSFTIVAKNIGDGEATQVVISAKFDEAFDRDTIRVPSGQLAGASRSPAGEVQWSIPSIPPKGEVTRTVVIQGKFAAARACCIATVIDAARQPVVGDKCLTLQAPGVGQGPFKIDIRANAAPAKLNSDVNYRVSISNLGRESEKQVQVTIVIPEEMSLIGQPQANVREQSRENKRLVFAPIAELRPTDAPMHFDFVLRADRVGEAKLQVEVTSINIPTPLTTTETTTIVP